MKTILFPTDFSKRANYALKETVGLAKKLGAKIIIYHVYHRPATEKVSSGHSDRLLENLERDIDMSFKGLLAENPGLADLDHEFRKELGFLSDCLVNISEKEGISLVCMATKGAKTFGELRRDQSAQRDIIANHDQAYCSSSRFYVRSKWDSVCHDGNFTFKVNAPVFVWHNNVITRREQRIRTALVHQRVRPESIRQLGST